MKFSAKSAGGLYDPYVLKSVYMRRWDEILTDFNNIAAHGVNNTIQTAGLDWSLMVMELEFVRTMLKGLMISIGFLTLLGVSPFLH